MALCWSLERHLSYGCYALSVWFPRVAINGLLLWSIVSLYRAAHQLGSSRTTALVLDALAAVLAALLAYTYALVIVVGAGSPREFPELLGDEESGVLPTCIRRSVLAKSDGRPRHCSKCLCWKPDRTHHCSACRQCHLRMDHHCPWFSSCVGFRNHKFFLQFLWYVVVYVALCFTVALLSLTQFFRTGEYDETYIDVNTVIFAIMSLAFLVAVGAFTVYTTWLVASNQTTLESMEGASYRTSLASSKFRYREAPSLRSIGNVFDLGAKENMRQVLGTTWWEWLLPVKLRVNPLDGTEFPTNQQVLDQAEARAQAEISLRERANPHPQPAPY